MKGGDDDKGFELDAADVINRCASISSEDGAAFVYRSLHS